MILFYFIGYILNSLVSINLPDQFTFCDSRELRCARKTVDIINNKDRTCIKCTITKTSDSFRNSFFYRTMNLWNVVPYEIRQEPSLSLSKTKLTKLLWAPIQTGLLNLIYILPLAVHK